MVFFEAAFLVDALIVSIEYLHINFILMSINSICWHFVYVEIFCDNMLLQCLVNYIELIINY